MGDPIKAERIAKHFAAKVSASLQSTPFGKRSVPSTAAVTFELSQATAMRTYGNSANLFLLRSVAVKPGVIFKPTECLKENPIEGSYATSHGHMGIIMYPNGKTDPGAINCGVEATAMAKCAADISALLEALAERMANEIKSPLKFFNDYQRGQASILSKLAGKGEGYWNAAKGLYEKAVSATSSGIEYVMTKTPGEVLSDLESARQGAISWTADRFEDIAELSKLSWDEVKQICMDWLKEMLGDLTCEARDLLKEMLANPKPLAEQMGELDAAIKVEALEAAGGIVVDVFVTKGAASAATKLGKVIGKAGAKIGKLTDKLKDAIAKRKAGKHPSTTPAPAAKPHPHVEEPKTPPGDKNKGPQGEAEPQCQLCPLAGKRPINPIYGTKVLQDESDRDFVLDGPLPFAWQRSYVSGNSDIGWIGQGWSVPIAFRIDVDSDAIVFVDTQGRRTTFPHIAIGKEFFSKYEAITLKRTGLNAYEVVTSDRIRLLFGPVGIEAARIAKQEGHKVEQQRSIAKADGQALNVAQEADLPAAPQTDSDAEDRHPPQVDMLALVGMVDPNENRIRIAWRPDGLPHSLIDSIGRTIGFDFDATRLIGIYEKHGLPGKDGLYQLSQLELLVKYSYSPQGDLIAVIDATGNTVRTFAWQNHIMVEHAEPGGIVSSYEWDRLDPQGRVTKSTLNTGECWEFVYDELERKTIVTDVSGRRTIYHFDEEKRFIGTTDPSGGRTIRRLDPYGNLIALIDPSGRTTRYSYDLQCNLIGIEQADGSTTRLAYELPLRNPIAISDALGQTAQLAYDERGNLIETTGVDGATTQYRLNARGLPTAIIDSLGGMVRLDYDAAFRVIASTDCSGNSTHYEYDRRNNLTAVTDAHGGRTEFTYEQINRQSRITSTRYPDNAEERFGYDQLGRLIAYHDPMGHVTRYAFDYAGRPVRRQNVLGHALQYNYDVHGRLASLINETGAVTRFAYDVLDRLVAEQAFDGRRSDYRYDRTGNLLESTDGATPGTPLMGGGRNVIRTRYFRDVMGRLLERISFKPTTSGISKRNRNRYAYDAAGQLVQARNHHARIDFYYTSSGQLLREVSRTRLQHNSTVQHRYDALGNRIATTLPDGRILNHLTYGSGHVHQINLDGDIISDFERDALHREKSRTQGRLASRYVRDGMGRLLASAATMDQPNPPDPLVGGRGANQRFLPAPPSGQGIVRRYEYDRSGQLLQIDDSRRGGTRYKYDPIGRLLAAQTRDRCEAFAFDPAHNLIDAQAQETDPRSKTAKTTYTPEEWAALVQDNIANPRFNPLQADPWSPQDPSTWGAYKPNHLLVWQEHRYRYDHWGNCIEKKSGTHVQQQYEWDADHQLVKATITQRGKAETWCYEYDPFGRRIAKYRIVKARSDVNSLVHLVWDGNRILLDHARQPDRQTLYIYEPDSFVPLALVRTKEQPVPMEPDPPFALPSEWLTLKDRFPEHWKKVEVMQRKTASQLGVPVDSIQHSLFKEKKVEQPARTAEVFYVHADHLGTPQELTDATGTVVWTATYKAWGRTEAITHPPRVVTRVVGNTVQEQLEDQTDPVVQNLRYQGQYFDSETGLHYNRMRYYDPDCGRFISHDPIGLSGGINTYLYAPNPTGWIDPLGLSPCRPCPLDCDKILDEAGIKVGRHGDMKKTGGLFDSHHIYQDAAVNSLPNYSYNDATAIVLQGRNQDGTTRGTPHYKANRVQGQLGGGTVSSEGRIGYKAMRRAGLNPEQARCAKMKADSYLSGIGANPSSKTTIPKPRK